MSTATPETTLTVDRDVRFRETPERTLAMDVYRPTDEPGSADGRPAALCVHGGGWREGSKGQLSRSALDFAS
ncbi:hypothetical protein ACFQE1_15125, partial [Halobium palmae]